MPSVPSSRDVVPGSLVNIVLKADQPTGRTVQGTVAQLLTWGDHPRGIKVRLTDGRVGRVQSMAAVTAEGADSIDPSLAGGRASGEQPRTGGSAISATSGGRWRHRGRDRGNEEQPASTQLIGLDAYIKPARRRGKGPAHAVTQTPGEPSNAEELTCPVCSSFKGDIAALNFHVQSHFDD